ncbi:MAG: hypothetical protein KF778_20895 [Rhodocyclaceae bacterium]|nr:hypothetical protein [Rhodocyclaceae bacterium]
MDINSAALDAGYEARGQGGFELQPERKNCNGPAANAAAGPAKPYCKPLTYSATA